MKKLLQPLAIASILAIGSATTAFAQTNTPDAAAATEASSSTPTAPTSTATTAIANPDAAPSPQRTRTRRRPIDLSGPHGVGPNREDRGRPADVGRAHGRGDGTGHGSPHAQ